MGLMDAFTSDGTVEMKHDEFYKLMREAARAEILSNAARAKVPIVYINAMLTGQELKIENILEEDMEAADFSIEYKQITAAVVRIFDAWEKMNGVDVASKSLHRLIDTLATARLDELKVIEENRKEQEEKQDKMLKAFQEAWEKMPKVTASINIEHPKEEQEEDVATDGKPEEDAESEGKANGNE